MIDRKFPIYRYQDKRIKSLDDRIICERHLSLYVNNSLLDRIPVTDRDIEDLVRGYLYTKGYLRREEAPHMEREGMVCRVTLKKELVKEALLPVRSEECFSPDHLSALTREFENLPSVYHATGGVHMAAAASRTILFWADDISRRSAVDKVCGKALKAGGSLSGTFLLTSCRLTSDLILKAVLLGFPLLISLSAPTDRALEQGDAYGITICGFARQGRFNIYTHPERICGFSGNEV